MAEVAYPCPPGCELKQMGVEHTHDKPPAANPALVAKLAEVFSAENHLHAAMWSLREWFSKRKPGEDFGLRLLDCQLWAANLEWLLVQAQIIVKGEEK